MCCPERQLVDKEKFFVWCAVKRHLGKTSLNHTRIRYDFLFRWLEKKKLTAESSEAFILYLREKNLRNASINSYIRVINLIDIYERERGKDFNLLKKISYFPKQAKVPTVLTLDEIEAIIAVKLDYSRLPYKNYGHDIDTTYRYSIWFIAATGCRFNEMATLRVENLHLGKDGGNVVFKDTKTLVDRQVPIPPRLSDALKEFIHGKKPKALVFTTSTGNKITAQCFNPELRKRSDKAGVKKHVYAHCFRNSYIIEHRRAGTDILTLAMLVGHRDPKTTLGYDKFKYDDLLRGAENHPMFAKSIAPEKVLKKEIEQIEKRVILNDPRFKKRIIKTDNSISLLIRIA